jgi:hypothetical protein
MAEQASLDSDLPPMVEPLRIQHEPGKGLWLRRAGRAALLERGGLHFANKNLGLWLPREAIFERVVTGFPWMTLLTTKSNDREDVGDRRFVVSMGPAKRPINAPGWPGDVADGGLQDGADGEDGEPVILVVTADMGRMRGQPEDLLLTRHGSRISSQLARCYVTDCPNHGKPALYGQHSRLAESLIDVARARELEDEDVLGAYARMVELASPLDPRLPVL